MKPLTSVLALLVVLLSPARAQAPQVLTLEESIRMAQAGSPAAEIARLEFAQSQAEFRGFRSTYLPSLFLNGDAPGWQRSIVDVVQPDGTVRYLQQNRTSSTMRLSVSQPLPFTGGEVFVSSGLSRVEQFRDENEFLEWQSAPLLIGVSQPLFQFNTLRWNRRTEPLRYQVAQRVYSEALEQAALDATQLFFEVYLAAMNVDILAFNVAVNDTIYTLSVGRFEIGRIAENDLLQSELALLNAQTALAEARIAYDEALQDLKTALRLPYDAEVEVVPPSSFPEVTIDPAEAVAKAQANRSAFLNMELQELLADRAVAQARRSNGLGATISASFGLNQSATAFGDVYLDPLNQQRLSISFEVPVFQWGRGEAERAAAEAARAATEQEIILQREELEQEVYFEALRFRQLQEQVRLAATADTIAARRFEVTRNRYAIGTIDITDLFDAQREKDSARRAFIQTLRSYWVSYFRLRRLTLYDFLNKESLRQF